MCIRDRVWVDYEYSSHDGVTDSTGSHSITQVGSPAAGTSPIGSDSAIISSTSQYGRADGVPNLAYPYTLTALYKRGASTSTVVPFSYVDASSDNQMTGILNRDNGAAGAYTREGAGAEAASTSATHVNAQWGWVVGVFNSTTNRKAYLDGGNEGVNTNTDGKPSNLDRISYGRLDDSSPSSFFIGEIAEMRVSNTEISPDQISIEYDNQSTTGSWWIAADAGGAISVTPNAINSGSVSNNPTISYSSVLNLAPSVIDSASVSLDPTIEFNSILFLTPTVIDSVSVSLDPAIQFGGVLSLAPLAIDSASLALDPVINYSSVLNITPLAIDSLSVAVDPTISYTSALVLSPQVIDSQSLSINPLIEYKSVINLTPNTINSFSASLNPIITTGEVQTLGNITAGFADDLYSVKYKLSGITVNFKG